MTRCEIVSCITVRSVARAGSLPDIVAVKPDVRGARSRRRSAPAHAISWRGEVSCGAGVQRGRPRPRAGDPAWPRLSRRPGAPEPNRRRQRSQCRVHRSRASALAQAFVLRRIGMSRVPVTVLTGFLGAGKTTLLRSLLTQADGRRIAVIANEFGDAGFDGGLVEVCAAKACAPGDIVELTNGCICCTVADDFVPTMDKLLSRDRPLDAIVIETSGLALPQPLLKAFDWPPGA